MKHYNLHLFRVPGVQEKKKGADEKYKETMAAHFTK